MGMILKAFVAVIALALIVQLVFFATSSDEDTETTAKPDTKPTAHQKFQSWASDTKDGIVYYGDCGDANVYTLRVQCVVATMIIEEVNMSVRERTQYAAAYDNCWYMAL